MTRTWRVMLRHEDTRETFHIRVRDSRRSRAIWRAAMCIHDLLRRELADRQWDHGKLRLEGCFR